MLRPKEVVCRWVDAFNGHDVEAIAGLYHDGAVNHQVANEPVEGIEAIREMFAAEFAAANMTAIVENIFEDGQWAILVPRGYWDKLSFFKQHNLPVE